MSDQRIGDWDGDERIEVTLVLRPRPDGGSLAARIDALRSAAPGRRDHLTYAALEAQHGAHPDDVAAVLDHARIHRLESAGSSAVGPSVKLAGKARDVASAFGVEIGRYQRTSAGKQTAYRGFDGALQVPPALEPRVRAVLGLDTRPLARTHFIVLGPAAAGQGNTALAVAQTYGAPAQPAAAGTHVGIIELGGGYAIADVQAYAQQLNVALPSVTDVLVDGGTNTPSPGGPSVSSADGEVALDIDVVAAVAQGAAITVYFAPNTEQGFVDAVARAAQDGCSAISISWGAPEADWSQAGMTAFDQACQGALAMGIPVFASSGDRGSADGLSDGRSHADFPASSPHVAGCGGTALPSLDLSQETAWNDLAAGGGAGGGGVSDVWPLPRFQLNASTPPSANDGQRRRAVPDLAGDAAPSTGYRILVGGQWFVLGGTSAVSPLIASLHALLDAALASARPGQRIGDFNSLLYSQFAPAAAMHDIATGNNGQYTAGPGYDAVTGWGTPDFARWRQIVLGGA